MQRIYFDNAATTPLDKEVIEVMTQSMMDNFGNPSSSHEFGRKAKAQVETARKNIAKYFNCSPSEVIFTAGGSEADNLILLNAVKNLGVERIISSPIEHHAVLHTIEALQKDYGTEVEYLSIDQRGEIDYNELDVRLKKSKKMTLVSLMLVNNEIGNILNAKQVCRLCKEAGALFHSDTVQGIAHVEIDLQENPIDFIVASAHKFHGPKGVGFAIIKKGFKIEPMLHGGEQEMGSRAGTENTHGIIGLDKALSLAMDHFIDEKNYVSGLKEYFIQQLKNKVTGVSFNGLSSDLNNSAFHILNVRFPVNKPMLMFNLDLKGIAVSGGSACQSGSNKGSHVLSSILDENAANQTSVRFSFSKFNSKEEIDYVIDEIAQMITK